MDRSCGDIDKRRIPKSAGRTGKQAINQITDFWPLLDYNCSPGAGINRWVQPGLQGHSTGEIQRIRVIHRYPVVVGSIEVESTSESSLAAPGCAVNSSCIVVPRRVRYRRPAPLIKTVSSYQTSSRRWRRCRCRRNCGCSGCCSRRRRGW